MASRAIIDSADDTVLQCPIGATLICLPTLSYWCEIPGESEKRHIRALRPFTQDESRRLQPFEAAHQTDRLPPEQTPPGGALATRATRQPTVRQSVTVATWTLALSRTGARRSAASGPAPMKWKKRSISAGWVIRAQVSGLVVR